MLTAESWAADAVRPDGAAWTVTLAAGAMTVPPLSKLALLGELATVDGLALPAVTPPALSLPADATACVAGESALLLPEKAPDGAAGKLHVRQCWQAGKPLASEFSGTIAHPLLGDVTLSGTPDAKGQLCIQGVASKPLPGAIGPDGKALAPSPLTVRYCLTKSADAFAAPTYSATVDLPDVGALALTGGAQGEGLCLSGNASIAAAGDKGADLPLTVQACADAKLKTLTTTAKATLLLPLFGSSQVVASLGQDAGKLCFVAMPAATFASDAAATLLAQGCTALDGKGGPIAWSFSTKLATAGLGDVAMEGTFDAAANGGKGGLCLGNDALKGLNPALLPLKGVTVLSVSLQTCLGTDTKTFAAPALRHDLQLGAPAIALDKGGVALRATTTLDASGGLCEISGDTDACAAAEKAWRKAVPDPSKHLDSRYVYIGGSCMDATATSAKTCVATSTGAQATWTSALVSAKGAPLPKPTLRHTVSLLPCVQGANGPCSSSWTPFSQMPIGAPYDVRTAGHSTLGGNVLARGGVAILEARASADSIGALNQAGVGKATLVSEGGKAIVALKQVGTHLQIAVDGKTVVALAGRSDLDLTGSGFAPWNVPAWIEGVPGARRWRCRACCCRAAATRRAAASPRQIRSET